MMQGSPAKLAVPGAAFAPAVPVPQLSRNSLGSTAMSQTRIVAESKSEIWSWQIEDQRVLLDQEVAL